MFPVLTLLSSLESLRQAQAQANQSRQMTEWAKQGLARAEAVRRMAEDRALAEATGLREVPADPLLLTDQRVLT